MSIISDRINNAQISSSVNFAQRVREKASSGEKVYRFHIGESHFKTPTEITSATKSSLDAGETLYSSINGIPELREAILDKLKAEQNLEINSNQIVVGNGSKHLLYKLFQVIINPGDEVLIPVPYWVSFPEMVKLAGGKPVFVSAPDNDLNIQEMQKSISPRTKAIIINSPNNPSGLVYSEEKLKAVLDLAKSNNLLIVSDEAYEALCFDDENFVGPAMVGDPRLENVCIVQSFSKGFCMTGFRLGYIAAREDLIKSINLLGSHLTGNVAVYTQRGGIAALKNKNQIVEDFINKFQIKRDLSLEILQDLKKMIIQKPQGGFYLFPNIQGYLENSKYESDIDLAVDLLDNKNVAVLAGSYFGQPGFLRISFAQDREDLKAGISNIRDFLWNLE